MDQNYPHLSNVEQMIAQHRDPERVKLGMQLWKLSSEIFQMIATRFQLFADSSVAPLNEFASSDGMVKGSLCAFSGPDVDWLVHTSFNHLESGLLIHRLTVWLSQQTQVPHLTMDLGIFSTLFFYLDYIPRVELLTNPDYLVHYYEPANTTFLKLKEDERVSPYVSKSPLIREFQSPTALCHSCYGTEQDLELIQSVGQEWVERWFSWLETAETVPEASRPTLAERDLQIRRFAAERDPGNQSVEKLLGTETARALVRGLWGADRVSS